MAVAVAVWTAGHLVWTWYGVIGHRDPPFPSFADAGYIGYSLPLLAGLLLFPRSSVRTAATVRVALDTAVVALSLVYISWATVLGPVYASGGHGFPRLVSLAYPVVDVTVCALVFALGTRAPAGTRLRWLLLGVGWTVLTVTDSIYVSLLTKGTTGSTGTVLAAGWVAAFLLVAAATQAGEDTVTGSRVQHFSVVQELLPYLPVFGAILVAALHRFDSGDRFLDLTGAVLLVLFAAPASHRGGGKGAPRQRPGANGAAAHRGAPLRRRPLRLAGRLLGRHHHRHRSGRPGQQLESGGRATVRIHGPRHPGAPDLGSGAPQRWSSRKRRAGQPRNRGGTP